MNSCVSSKVVEVFQEEKITGPKVVAMLGPRKPWIFQIEKRLKQDGFKVLRTTNGARYILNIEGHAPIDPMNRCFGGGYNFDYITVELIDTLKNETLFYYSDSGFTEGCPPMSGTIFGDIRALVRESWE
jgi:hypothetical protein